VIVTAGLPRKPGMSRMDLIETNAKIVRSVVENVAKYAPDAVLIVVSNPLDEMTALAAKVSGFPHQRVMGQAGMLDTARFSYFVAEKLAVPVGSVRTLTLGSHGDTMVPVPSACTVNGQPLASLLPADEIEQLVTRTRNGGGEIVGLLKTGSAYYAPSAAAARMARAVAEDSGAVMPVCAWVDGEYGISGVYLGVEAEIGREGVRRVVERDLTESELAALRTAAEAGPRQAGRRGQPLTQLHPAGRVSAETRPADRHAGQCHLVLERAELPADQLRPQVPQQPRSWPRDLGVARVIAAP
jgi:malate dehydrogenase